MVILSLTSFLSIILVIGSPLKSYTNFYENNNHIFLKITPIYAQGNSGDFEDGDIFPDFKAEYDGGEEKDGDIFPDFKSEYDGGEEKDGVKEKGGGEERINENTNDFSPLSSGSPINTDDKINPYGSPINTDDKVGQPVGQQSEQEVEDPVQVDQQSGQQVDQQTVGNEVNQTEQQTVGNEVNQTEQQTVGNEVNQTEQQQYTGEKVDQ
jgi:hypothetical protein